MATAAFWAYTRTLLPGVDLGDTGGFQAAVLAPEISARQAYPLYYFLAKPFVGAVAARNPAAGLNLFSAVWAAIAVGLLTWVAAVVGGSRAGGVAAGLLLAFSYTFWSQAVIAEVYTLHLALVGLCLVALVAWQRRPTLWRLTLFFAVYALSFGNHLSMILLFVPFTVFLLMNAEQPQALVRPPVIGAAAAMAVVGALQYLPNLMALWTSLDAPDRWLDRLAAFWFEVTREDWRESMVFGVSGSELVERAAMFGFDARQQFGIVGVALAALGPMMLWRTRRAWSVLLVLAYGVNTLFAFTYNVGDPHVFFLPGHYFTALAAGCAITAVARKVKSSGRRVVAPMATGAVLLYAAWRGYDTWPAVDRHADRRGDRMGTRLTFGIDERDALLVAQLNWQVENVLIYETRYRSPQVAWTRLSDVLLHFPLLVRDNHAIGRDVVLTADAARQVASAFGPLLPLVADDRSAPASFPAIAARIPRGALYVLCLLTPPRDEQVDALALREGLRRLTTSTVPQTAGGAYEVFVGRTGEAPLWHHAESRPFRHRLRLIEGELDVRMESWVPLETFRRGGFGHITLDRQHLLAVERGISLVWLDDTAPTEPFYFAGLYAPQPQFSVVAGGGARLALH